MGDVMGTLISVSKPHQRGGEFISHMEQTILPAEKTWQETA